MNIINYGFFFLLSLSMLSNTFSQSNQWDLYPKREYQFSNSKSSHLANNFYFKNRFSLRKVNLFPRNNIEQIRLADSVFTTLSGENFSYIYTYDNDGRQTEILSKKMVDGVWINYQRITFTYDFLGNMSIKLTEQYWSNKWVSRNRFLYSYNLKRLKIVELLQYSVNDQWYNLDQFKYEYDLDNNLLVEIYEIWDSDHWDIWGRSSFSYNLDGNVITEMYETLDVQTHTLKNHFRYSFTYNYDGKVDFYIFENWSDLGWVISQRKTFSYDMSGLLISELLEAHNSTEWFNVSRITSTYDNSKNLVSIKSEDWNFNSWRNNYRYTYTYDLDYKLLYGLREDFEFNQWKEADGQFEVYDYFGNKVLYEASRISLVYREITDVVDEEISANEFVLFQNFPNPFNPTTTISYSILKSGRVELRIYNLLSGEIFTLVNEEQAMGFYSVDFDASSLTSGIYIYRLQSGKYTETKKMILLK